MQIKKQKTQKKGVIKLSKSKFKKMSRSEST